jgi:hypothetical protein
MGSVGGLFETLKFLGILVFGVFAQWLFMSKLIKNVYQVRNYENITHEIDRRRRIQGDDEACEASHANLQYNAEI